MHIFSISPKPENKRSQLLIFFNLGIASRNQNYVSMVTLLVTAILTIYLQQVLWDTRDSAAKCKIMYPVPLHRATRDPIQQLSAKPWVQSHYTKFQKFPISQILPSTPIMKGQVMLRYRCKDASFLSPPVSTSIMVHQTCSPEFL